jgi:hypothetical protein
VCFILQSHLHNTHTHLPFLFPHVFVCSVQLLDLQDRLDEGGLAVKEVRLGCDGCDIITCHFLLLTRQETSVACFNCIDVPSFGEK